MGRLITFKTAVLAKERGFPQNSFNASWYNEFGDKNGRTDLNKEGKTYNEVYNSYSMSIPLEHKEEFNRETFLAPTQSELQTWLLDNYKLHINICALGLKKWSFMLEELSIDGTLGRGGKLGKENYSSYGDALEVGLEEALKLLP